MMYRHWERNSSCTLGIFVSGSTSLCPVSRSSTTSGWTVSQVARQRPQPLNCRCLGIFSHLETPQQKSDLLCPAG
ncbi:hypothetical protein DPMN_059959 [Dreissena polymorpha]|uniref:Uncharacterized protein n=1 Tax=Dreissena polymorpha TaxID=45954 RepID=A0A9D4C534_DREPO|nr:hypothetical protein DPMN_059959 [Dreissena polymorpha]